MENETDKTIETYKENFQKYIERTPSEVVGAFKEWEDIFCSFITEGNKIFEIGSATGRDARYFKSKGFEVFCTDVIPEALEGLKKEGFETAEFNFKDNPSEKWIDSFDGVFANAVFLHATQQEFEQNLLNIYEILKEDGILAFSLKIGQGEEVLLAKMDAPRFFRYYEKEELEKILAKYPYQIISINKVDNDKWLHVILKKN